MSGRWMRNTVRVLLVGAVLLGTVGSSSADSAVKTERFAAEGTVVDETVPVPPSLDGATGGFVLHKEVARPAGVDGSADPDGNFTIYEHSDTGYSECDANGENCRRSTRAQVVTEAAHLKVIGRYYVVDGRYQLVAREIWNPTKAPPPPAPPTGPNPQPKTLADFTNGNLFGVRAKVVATKVDVLGGFKVGNFDSDNGFGCGAVTGCKVERIAQAHAGRLTIEPRGALTTYYMSDDGGCSYTKTTDSYSVLYKRGPVNGVRVSGRYTWGGLDWVFTATRVWTPAPKTPEECSTTRRSGLEVFSVLSQQEEGTHAPETDATPETWTGSHWEGTNGIGDFGAGSSIMDLDWTLVDGGWEFSGAYSVFAGPTSPNSISGAIQGIARPQSDDPSETQWDISSQVTITSATGKYQGWSGDGQWTGFGTGDWATPPSAQQGSFRWLLAPP